MSWVRPPLQPIHEGYLTNKHDYALAEACRRLNTVVVGPGPRPTGTAVHASVALLDGTQCWLKVTGLVGQAENSHRRAEVEAEALVGISKPTILARVDWTNEEVCWRATLMTLAPSPAVSLYPWCLPGSIDISDMWLDDLRDALKALCLAPCQRIIGPPEEIRNVISTFIDCNVPTEAEDWHACHGDLHWSNVTNPSFMLLDWESWCLAPRGYDIGRLLAFSVLNPTVTRRLLVLFADELETPSGQVGLWAGIAIVKHQIAAGQIDPALGEPLGHLIRQMCPKP